MQPTETLARWPAGPRLAAPLLDGGVGLSTFPDEMMELPSAQASFQRVEAREDASQKVEKSLVHERYVEVCAKLVEGLEMVRRVERPRGDPALPLGLDDLVNEYRDYAGTIFPEADVAHSLELLLTVGKQPSLRSAPGKPDRRQVTQR